MVAVPVWPLINFDRCEAMYGLNEDIGSSIGEKIFETFKETVRALAFASVSGPDEFMLWIANSHLQNDDRTMKEYKRKVLKWPDEDNERIPAPNRPTLGNN
jgi:hypothetical protein